MNTATAAARPIPQVHRNVSGYVLECDAIPAGVPELLEAQGYALIAARTVEGLYVEPTRHLSKVIGVVEAFGVRVYTVRRAGGWHRWHEGARPPARSRARLTNPRGSSWLPTLPAA